MDELEFKIFNSLGRHRQRHLSQITEVPRSPGLLLKRPDRRGYFSIDTVTPVNEFERFEVFLECAPLGVMTYNDILAKFSAQKNRNPQ